MPVTDLTGLIAAVASLGALTPLAAEVTQWRKKREPGQRQGDPMPWLLFAFTSGVVAFSFAAMIVIFGLTTSLAMNSGPAVSLRITVCLLSFLTVLTGSVGTARVLHGSHSNAAVLGSVGILAGFGAIFAMIAVG
jgi:fumarate reductase subunit D